MYSHQVVYRMSLSPTAWLIVERHHSTHLRCAAVRGSGVTFLSALDGSEKEGRRAPQGLISTHNC